MVSCQTEVEKESPKKTSRIEFSPVEKITYDQKLIEIKLMSDSTFLTYSNDSVIKYENYIINSQCNAFVSYRQDTLLAIGIRKNNLNIFTAEYYPNHQIKGVLPVNLNGQFDGLSKYYHLNGRVKTIGNWQNNSRTGEWKNYSQKGSLISTDIYENGQLIETIENEHNIN